MTFIKTAAVSILSFGLVAAPAAFAQTNGGATSTGGAQIEKDRTEMNETRTEKAAPPSNTQAPAARKSMDDTSTGSTSAAPAPKSGKPVQGTDTSD